MTQIPRPLVAGNWKMNGLKAAIGEIEKIGALVSRAPNLAADVAICPSATVLGAIGGTDQGAGGSVILGGQTCHEAASGAHTGDISAEMLADAGAKMVIVGHSERRADHGESNEDVAAKAKAAWRAGLIAVICVGETLEERQSGNAVDLVLAQIAGSVPEGSNGQNTVIAYEPVWAIGTGKVPTSDDIAEMHAALRAKLSDIFGAETANQMRLVYGGSVKAANAKEILGIANVDGGLVGGASLKAEDFWGIVEVYA